MFREFMESKGYKVEDIKNSSMELAKQQGHNAFTLVDGKSFYDFQISFNVNGTKILIDLNNETIKILTFIKESLNVNEQNSLKKAIKEYALKTELTFI